MHVVVLNDGETFSSIEGCVVLEIPDTVDVDSDDLDDYVAENYHSGMQITVQG